MPRIDPASDYRYREAMLMWVNCGMLYWFTWMQFVVFFQSVSYEGLGLWLYCTVVEPFGLTLPETFIRLSIGLSVFALGAVWFGTRGVGGHLKRFLVTLFFAILCIALPSMMHVTAGWQLPMLEEEISSLRETNRDSYHLFASGNERDIAWDNYNREKLARLEELRSRFLEYRLKD